MYKKLVSKIENHFGKEGLIIYSKSCDYYKTNPLTEDEIKMYYNLIITNEPVPRSPSHLACCLYYLAKREPQYKQILFQQIIMKLNKRRDEINDTNLFLIFNVIEFEIKYLHSEKKKIEFLTSYLERFSSQKKTVENFLLYKYYRAILHFLLGDYKDANREYMELVMELHDEVTNKSHFTDFISLKNDLFYAEFSKKTNRVDLHEQYFFLDDLFKRVLVDNKFLAVKLGFSLYSNLYRQNRLIDCLNILYQMKKILKSESLSGVNLQNVLDYSLAICSRIGYIGILTNDQTAIDKSIKKIEKSLALIGEDRSKKKLSILSNAYSFVVNILKMNKNNFVERPKELAAMFKNAFFPNNMEIPNNSDSFYIVNTNNQFDCIVNLNSINNMDYAVSSKEQQIMNSCISSINRGSPLEQSLVLAFIAGMHNYINRLSESFCTDNNFNKQNDYKQKIILSAEKVFQFAKNFSETEPLLHTEFVKSLLIRIYSSYSHVYIYNKNLEMIKNNINFFDTLAKKLEINENTTSYELVNKVKGDFWYFKNDLNGAISYYNKSVEKMDNLDPKKPIIYFNLGCLYFLFKNKEQAVQSLHNCLNSFRQNEQNKVCFDFYSKGRMNEKKQQQVKMLLDQLTRK